jgi:hypothetical protein
VIDVLDEQRIGNVRRVHADRLGGHRPAGQPLHRRAEAIGAAIDQVIELEFGEEILDSGAPPRHFSLAKTRIFRRQDGAQPRRQRQIRCRFGRRLCPRR